ncbi:MAG: hypothetical protein CPSOU_4099 [uncultured Paraburkholderia sp.]|nr:MAG: hypothetical protein CPSOU_4099 [uncultured Paraburkholderia sp.]
MSIKAIWFDFGGVLSPTIDDLYTTYESKTGVNRQQMEAEMTEVARPLGVHFLAPIELAMVTQIQWAAGMRKALGRLYPKLDISRCDFDRHGEQWFAGNEANPAMIRLVHKCKQAGFKVGILTNNVVEWEGPWRRMVGLDGIVDDIVDSCKVLVRKPDPRIFDLSAKRLCCAPEECVVIDDHPESRRRAVLYANRGRHAVSADSHPEWSRSGPSHALRRRQDRAWRSNDQPDTLQRRQRPDLFAGYDAEGVAAEPRQCRARALARHHIERLQPPRR